MQQHNCAVVVYVDLHHFGFLGANFQARFLPVSVHRSCSVHRPYFCPSASSEYETGGTNKSRHRP